MLGAPGLEVCRTSDHSRPKGAQDASGPAVFETWDIMIRKGWDLPATINILVRTALFVDVTPGLYQAFATDPGSTLTATATITVTD